VVTGVKVDVEEIVIVEEIVVDAEVVDKLIFG
jgi:hypothetical protein